MSILSRESLANREARSLAGAHHRMARSLGGRIRLAWELATGTSTDGPAKSGLNPDGLVGANRSGYPWGPAFQHPVWVGNGVRLSSNVRGDRLFTEVTSDADVVIPIVVYCRPFAMWRGAPYSRAYFRADVSRSTSGSPTTDVTIKANGFERTATVTASSSTPAAVSPTLWADLRPGLNRIELRFGASSGNDIQVVSCSLNQIVERLHS